MKEYLEKLNAEQREAAMAVDGHYLVYAGAGTGKTATLISRLAYMIDSGIDPKGILLLTFTNKAAKEMRDRAELMVGPNAQDVTACTFHSFCANFLRKNSSYLGLGEDFSIIDAVDAKEAVSIAKQTFLSNAKAAGKEYDYKDFPSAKDIVNIYSWSVNSMQDYETTIREQGMMGYCDEIIAIVVLYTEYKQEKAMLDYDDLLLYTEKILAKNESVRDYLGTRYKYVMVDEYQDTNTLQESLLKKMTEKHGNLMVVGDANQSIYAFRCANIQNIIGFKDRYPDAKTIVLSQNYRSSQDILDLPNVVMTYATEGDAVDLRGQFNGVRPKLCIVNSCMEEDAFIVNEIAKLHASGTPLRKIGVIARSGSQTYNLEMMLRQNSLNFEKFGGLRFLDKATIKCVLSYLRVCENATDEIAIYRLLQLYPGVGQTTAKRLASSATSVGDISAIADVSTKKKYAEYMSEFVQEIKKIETMNVGDQLHEIIDVYYKRVMTRMINAKKTSDASKGEDLKQLDKDLKDAEALYEMAKRYRSAKSFLDALVLDATVSDKDGDYVNLTTVHSAKGLEYDVVFVMNCVEGMLSRTNDGDVEDAEERRIFYVAITRAKKELYLMAPQYGNGRVCILSHFINQNDILEKIDVVGNKRALDVLRNNNSERNDCDEEW